ncbi:MAG: chemotaxis response regulator protein-glutamate methylesterase [Bacillota bacterium]|nr:chemotaxis response regulator protein-glutamate methylesterase [Bacillota bacterium]
MTAQAGNVIKVLVVDDSAFMRRVISDILDGDPEIKVISTATNGVDAIEKAKTLQPDLITLDIEMPLMNGLSCLQELLKTRFLPVIMLSSLTKAGTEYTIKALEYGAVDFIAKPENIFEMTGEGKKKEIIDKVKTAGRLKKTKVNTLPNDLFEENGFANKESTNSKIEYIVAIGTSTGGPKALQSVIPLIPGNIPAAFLVVQHMPPGFTKSLAERLNSVSKVIVKEAEDGEIVKAGHVYIAPGDYHMAFEKNNPDGLKIKTTRDAPVSGHRPAVNYMMDSLSQTGIKNVIGVIMTGMGGDGSDGVVMLKRNNSGYIIAQDEETCVVYGMPKMAVQTGVVDAVVPLNKITSEIIRIVGVRI